jgi:hypothetical protein
MLRFDAITIWRVAGEHFAPGISDCVGRTTSASPSAAVSAHARDDQAVTGQHAWSAHTASKEMNDEVEPSE